MQGGPHAERQAVFCWSQCFSEQVCPRTGIVDQGFPSSRSRDLCGSSMHVGQGEQWVKDKKEGHCQQRPGCHGSVTVTAARAQRATVHDESGHGTGFGHIPQA